MSLLGQPGNRAHRQARSLFQQMSLPLAGNKPLPLQPARAAKPSERADLSASMQAATAALR